MEQKSQSAKFWFILAAVFTLLDPVLAHLSNADLIHWSYGLEYVVSPVPFFWAIVFFIAGFLKLKSKI